MNSFSANPPLIAAVTKSFAFATASSTVKPFASPAVIAAAKVQPAP